MVIEWLLVVRNHTSHLHRKCNTCSHGKTIPIKKVIGSIYFLDNTTVILFSPEKSDFPDIRILHHRKELIHVRLYTLISIFNLIAGPSEDSIRSSVGQLWQQEIEMRTVEP